MSLPRRKEAVARDCLNEADSRAAAARTRDSIADLMAFADEAVDSAASTVDAVAVSLSVESAVLSWAFWEEAWVRDVWESASCFLREVSSEFSEE